MPGSSKKYSTPADFEIPLFTSITPKLSPAAQKELTSLRERLRVYHDKYALVYQPPVDMAEGVGSMYSDSLTVAELARFKELKARHEKIRVALERARREGAQARVDSRAPLMVGAEFEREKIKFEMEAIIRASGVRRDACLPFESDDLTFGNMVKAATLIRVAGSASMVSPQSDEAFKIGVHTLNQLRVTAEMEGYSRFPGDTRGNDAMTAESSAARIAQVSAAIPANIKAKCQTAEALDLSDPLTTYSVSKTRFISLSDDALSELYDSILRDTAAVNRMKASLHKRVRGLFFRQELTDEEKRAIADAAAKNLGALNPLRVAVLYEMQARLQRAVDLKGGLGYNPNTDEVEFDSDTAMSRVREKEFEVEYEATDKRTHQAWLYDVASAENYLPSKRLDCRVVVTRRGLSSQHAGNYRRHLDSFIQAYSEQQTPVVVNDPAAVDPFSMHHARALRSAITQLDGSYIIARNSSLTAISDFNTSDDPSIQAFNKLSSLRVLLHKMQQFSGENLRATIDAQGINTLVVRDADGKERFIYDVLLEQARAEYRQWRSSLPFSQYLGKSHLRRLKKQLDEKLGFHNPTFGWSSFKDQGDVYDALQAAKPRIYKVANDAVECGIQDLWEAYEVNAEPKPKHAQLIASYQQVRRLQMVLKQQNGYSFFAPLLERLRVQTVINHAERQRYRGLIKDIQKLLTLSAVDERSVYTELSEQCDLMLRILDICDLNVKPEDVEESNPLNLKTRLSVLFPENEVANSRTPENPNANTDSNNKQLLGVLSQVYMQKYVFQCDDTGALSFNKETLSEKDLNLNIVKFIKLHGNLGERPIEDVLKSALMKQAATEESIYLESYARNLDGRELHPVLNLEQESDIPSKNAHVHWSKDQEGDTPYEDGHAFYPANILRINRDVITEDSDIKRVISKSLSDRKPELSHYLDRFIAVAEEAKQAFRASSAGLRDLAFYLPYRHHDAVRALAELGDVVDYAYAIFDYHVSCDFFNEGVVGHSDSGYLKKDDEFVQTCLKDIRVNQESSKRYVAAEERKTLQNLVDSRLADMLQSRGLFGDKFVLKRQVVLLVLAYGSKDAILSMHRLFLHQVFHEECSAENKAQIVRVYNELLRGSPAFSKVESDLLPTSERVLERLLEQSLSLGSADHTESNQQIEKFHACYASNGMLFQTFASDLLRIRYGQARSYVCDRYDLQTGQEPREFASGADDAVLASDRDYFISTHGDYSRRFVMFLYQTYVTKDTVLLDNSVWRVMLHFFGAQTGNFDTDFHQQQYSKVTRCNSAYRQFFFPDCSSDLDVANNYLSKDLEISARDREFALSWLKSNKDVDIKLTISQGLVEILSQFACLQRANLSDVVDFLKDQDISYSGTQEELRDSLGYAFNRSNFPPETVALIKALFPSALSRFKDRTRRALRLEEFRGFIDKLSEFLFDNLKFHLNIQVITYRKMLSDKSRWLELAEGQFLAKMQEILAETLENQSERVQETQVRSQQLVTAFQEARTSANSTTGQNVVLSAETFSYPEVKTRLDHLKTDINMISSCVNQFQQHIQGGGVDVIVSLVPERKTIDPIVSEGQARPADQGADVVSQATTTTTNTTATFARVVRSAISVPSVYYRGLLSTSQALNVGGETDAGLITPDADARFIYDNKIFEFISEEVALDLHRFIYMTDKRRESPILKYLDTVQVKINEMLDSSHPFRVAFNAFLEVIHRGESADGSCKKLKSFHRCYKACAIFMRQLYYGFSFEQALIAQLAMSSDPDRDYLFGKILDKDPTVPQPLQAEAIWARQEFLSPVLQDLLYRKKTLDLGKFGECVYKNRVSGSTQRTRSTQAETLDHQLPAIKAQHDNTQQNVARIVSLIADLNNLDFVKALTHYSQIPDDKTKLPVYLSGWLEQAVLVSLSKVEEMIAGSAQVSHAFDMNQIQACFALMQKRYMDTVAIKQKIHQLTMKARLFLMTACSEYPGTSELFGSDGRVYDQEVKLRLRARLECAIRWLKNFGTQQDMLCLNSLKKQIRYLFAESALKAQQRSNPRYGTMAVVVRELGSEDLNHLNRERRDNPELFQGRARAIFLDAIHNRVEYRGFLLRVNAYFASNFPGLFSVAQIMAEYDIRDVGYFYAKLNDSDFIQALQARGIDKQQCINLLISANTEEKRVLMCWSLLLNAVSEDAKIAAQEPFFSRNALYPRARDLAEFIHSAVRHDTVFQGIANDLVAVSEKEAKRAAVITAAEPSVPHAYLDLISRAKIAIESARPELAQLADYMQSMRLSSIAELNGVKQGNQTHRAYLRKTHAISEQLWLSLNDASSESKKMFGAISLLREQALRIRQFSIIFNYMKDNRVASVEALLVRDHVNALQDQVGDMLADLRSTQSQYRACLAHSLGSGVVIDSLEQFPGYAAIRDLLQATPILKPLEGFAAKLAAVFTEDSQRILRCQAQLAKAGDLPRATLRRLSLLLQTVMQLIEDRDYHRASFLIAEMVKGFEATAIACVIDYDLLLSTIKKSVLGSELRSEELDGFVASGLFGHLSGLMNRQPFTTAVSFNDQWVREASVTNSSDSKVNKFFTREFSNRLLAEAELKKLLVSGDIQKLGIFTAYISTATTQLAKDLRQSLMTLLTGPGNLSVIIRDSMLLSEGDRSLTIEMLRDTCASFIKRFSDIEGFQSNLVDAMQNAQSAALEQYYNNGSSIFHDDSSSVLLKAEKERVYFAAYQQFMDIFHRNDSAAVLEPGVREAVQLKTQLRNIQKTTVETLQRYCAGVDSLFTGTLGLGGPAAYLSIFEYIAYDPVQGRVGLKSSYSGSQAEVLNQIATALNNGGQIAQRYESFRSAMVLYKLFSEFLNGLTDENNIEQVLTGYQSLRAALLQESRSANLYLPGFSTLLTKLEHSLTGERFLNVFEKLCQFDLAVTQEQPGYQALFSSFDGKKKMEVIQENLYKVLESCLESGDFIRAQKELVLLLKQYPINIDLSVIIPLIENALKAKLSSQEDLRYLMDDVFTVNGVLSLPLTQVSAQSLVAQGYGVLPLLRCYLQQTKSLALQGQDLRDIAVLHQLAQEYQESHDTIESSLRELKDVVGRCQEVVGTVESTASVETLAAKRKELMFYLPNIAELRLKFQAILDQSKGLSVSEKQEISNLLLKLSLLYKACHPNMTINIPWDALSGWLDGLTESSKKINEDPCVKERGVVMSLAAVTTHASEAVVATQGLVVSRNLGAVISFNNAFMVYYANRSGGLTEDLVTNFLTIMETFDMTESSLASYLLSAQTPEARDFCRNFRYLVIEQHIALAAEVSADTLVKIKSFMQQLDPEAAKKFQPYVDQAKRTFEGLPLSQCQDTEVLGRDPLPYARIVACWTNDPFEAARYQFYGEKIALVQKAKAFWEELFTRLLKYFNDKVPDNRKITLDLFKRFLTLRSEQLISANPAGALVTNWSSSVGSNQELRDLCQAYNRFYSAIKGKPFTQDEQNIKQRLHKVLTTISDVDTTIAAAQTVPVDPAAPAFRRYDQTFRDVMVFLRNDVPTMINDVTTGLQTAGVPVGTFSGILADYSNRSAANSSYVNEYFRAAFNTFAAACVSESQRVAADQQALVDDLNAQRAGLTASEQHWAVLQLAESDEVKALSPVDRLKTLQAAYVKQLAAEERETRRVARHFPEGFSEVLAGLTTAEREDERALREAGAYYGLLERKSQLQKASQSFFQPSSVAVKARQDELKDVEAEITLMDRRFALSAPVDSLQDIMVQRTRLTVLGSLLKGEDVSVLDLSLVGVEVLQGASQAVMLSAVIQKTQEFFAMLQAELDGIHLEAEPVKHRVLTALMNLVQPLSQLVGDAFLAQLGAVQMAFAKYSLLKVDQIIKEQEIGLADATRQVKNGLRDVTFLLPFYKTLSQSRALISELQREVRKMEIEYLSSCDVLAVRQPIHEILLEKERIRTAQEIQSRKVCGRREQNIARDAFVRQEYEVACADLWSLDVEDEASLPAFVSTDSAFVAWQPQNAGGVSSPGGYTVPAIPSVPATPVRPGRAANPQAFMPSPRRGTADGAERATPPSTPLRPGSRGSSDGSST